ncbi:hypothetical protein AB0368_08830 [Actinoplanes sp. NPDC051475]|uniref:hypothetical protein n=1 Tax=Actinoplanes sp. NPDC051475 TaxID=3157225 RepID=UPI00344B4879
MSKSMRVWATVLLAASAGMAGGCGALGTGAASPRPEPSPSAQAPLPPRQALRKSIELVARSTFRLTFKDAGSTTTAAVDPAARNASMHSQKGSGEHRQAVQMRQIGDRLWMKLQASGVLTDAIPQQWMRIDPARLQRPQEMHLVQPDPTTATTVLDHIVTVTGGDDHYTGTVDLTATPKKQLITGFTLDKDALGRLGDRAKALPFDATTDEQGRLVQLTVSVPSVGDQPAYADVLTLHHFGLKVTPKAPAGAIDAVEYIYVIANSQ